MLNVTSPHSSKLPLLISSAEITAIPSSKVSVMSLHTAVGTCVFTSIIVCQYSAVLPLTSVAIQVIMFSPTIYSSGSLFDKLKTPQLSVT